MTIQLTASFFNLPKGSDDLFQNRFRITLDIGSVHSLSFHCQ